MATNNYSKITPEIARLAEICKSNAIDPELYTTYDVKRGLRDINGKGVLTGLTRISEVNATKVVDGETVPAPGELFYRGINVKDMIKGQPEDMHCGFEETTYLLLFGKLPNQQELRDFRSLLAESRSKMPKNFFRDVIMQKPSSDLMNNIQRGVLNLYAYDTQAADISIPNVLRQSLELISIFPSIAVHSYNAMRYYLDRDSLVVHRPRPDLSTAENFLYMLRPDNKFTPLEAKILDVSLMLHAEHGGGNNSTFTTHVVTSSGTDTYAAVVAALSSLKGPKHGGANIMVVKMFKELERSISDWEDDDEILAYLERILHKDAFDRTGVIYGMGHAIYSISDPRAQIFKRYVKDLSAEKGRSKEFEFYERVEKLSAELIAAERKIYKGVSANIDFYSGFVYSMLGIPMELYTPLFAIARISGWSAHRIEELNGKGKIIRPAYKSVQDRVKYRPLEERD